MFCVSLLLIQWEFCGHGNEQHISRSPFKSESTRAPTYFGIEITGLIITQMQVRLRAVSTTWVQMSHLHKGASWLFWAIPRPIFLSSQHALSLHASQKHKRVWFFFYSPISWHCTEQIIIRKTPKGKVTIQLSVFIDKSHFDHHKRFILKIDTEEML